MAELNDKQLKILTIAEKLFAEKGFDGTSIRDISKEAKINIAMVSYYFGSKDKMLESLILWRSADMRLQLESLLQERLDPMEKLDKLIELYIARINKNRCIYQIIHFEIASKKRDLNFAAFNEVKRLNLETLRKIINEGQQSGAFRKDVMVDLIPVTVIGTYFQFQMSRMLYQDIFQLRSDREFDAFIKTELTQHIKKTIKALLTNETK